MNLLDKLMSRRSARAQRGFTMVELAIVLVVARLILVAVLKGTDTVNKAKVERAVADLKGLQGMLLETQKR
ncbi:MAG: prepilin-type N-terminal cleavage/methylation domain-containing protein, partial [Rhodoferax sp.]|nr:prepilin-type N-terminal cleavage/methylation domain-containing protein [Rhodoferax sp.]